MLWIYISWLAVLVIASCVIISYFLNPSVSNGFLPRVIDGTYTSYWKLIKEWIWGDHIGSHEDPDQQEGLVTKD